MTMKKILNGYAVDADELMANFDKIDGLNTELESIIGDL